MKRMFTQATIVGMITAVASAAMAESGKVVLLGDVKLVKTVIENGKARTDLLEPMVVVPGDRLLFTTRFTNQATVSARNVVVTNPLPQAVVLQHETTEGYVISVDGGKTWGQLSKARASDGKGGLRPATANDVTHLRWVIQSIPPGASGTVRYQAIVR